MGQTLTAPSKQELFLAMVEKHGVEASTRLLATAALIPITEIQIEEAIMRKLLPTDRITTANTTYKRKKGRHPALTMTRWGEPPRFHPVYESIVVEPYLISTSPELSLLDIMDANFNEVQDVLDDAGKEMASKEDTDALAMFNKAAPLPGSAWPTSTNDPVTVSAGPGGIGRVLSTNVMRVGTTVTAPAGGVAGDVRIQDFLFAQSNLGQIGYKADAILTNPYIMGKLAGQDTFFLYLNSGDRQVREQGYIENTMGMKLISSPLVPQKTMYLLDTNETGRFVERNAVTVEANTKELIATWFIWERMCIFIRNANAIFRLAINV